VARAADFNLAAALASPSFTPGQKDAPALVELVVAGEEPAAQRAATALAKLDGGRAAVEARLAGAGPIGGDTAELGDGPTARLVGVIGLLARGGDTAARAALIERTRDVHVRVRRAAINALGKLGGDEALAALHARWDAADVTPDERRTLVEALGKIGDESTRGKVFVLETAGDAELERLKQRALLMIDRTHSRTKTSTIKPDGIICYPMDVILRCKRGLVLLLVEELASHGLDARPESEGAVLELGRNERWDKLYASRLWTSAALRIPLHGRRWSLEEQIKSALEQRQTIINLKWLTDGDIRYRLSFANGKHRALIWRVAQMLSSSFFGYVNDPTDSTWEFFVDEEAERMEMTPKKAVDPRFAWRVADVPAASHPTVAAALAYVAGAKPTDRVWDPFVGSGAELVERARLGPFASLTGSDLDGDALAAAQKNIDAAGLSARLVSGDARTFDPGGTDLVITNPPLGSRVHVDAATLLCDALPHFARVLASGGRLVWITPSTKRTSPVAERVGLRRTQQHFVDLGGVRGQLERWEKP